MLQICRFTGCFVVYFLRASRRDRLQKQQPNLANCDQNFYYLIPPCHSITIPVALFDVHQIGIFVSDLLLTS